MSEVIKKAVSKEKLKDVISLIGPSHAEEVIIGLLTCVNAVCVAMIILPKFSVYLL